MDIKLQKLKEINKRMQGEGFTWRIDDYFTLQEIFPEIIKLLESFTPCHDAHKENVTTTLKKHIWEESGHEVKCKECEKNEHNKENGVYCKNCEPNITTV